MDTLGLPIAIRVEPANMPDQKAGARLLTGLRPLFPAICTVMADAGHQSRELARALRHEGWPLVITKRSHRAFKIKGLTWIVERSFAWLGRNHRFSKNYEFRVQTSETLIEVATDASMPTGFTALALLTTLASGLPDPSALPPSWLPVRAPPVAHLSCTGTYGHAGVG